MDTQAIKTASQQLIDRALEVLGPLFLGRALPAFGPERGLWGSHPETRTFTVSEVGVVYGDAKSDNGFVSLNLRLASYAYDKDGLIYTDPTFLRAVRDVLAAAGLDGRAVDYSEAGLQGDDYVNFDVSFYTLKPSARPSANSAP